MKKKTSGLIKMLLVLILIVCFFLAFDHALSNLNNDRSLEGKQQLEEALRRAAITCYAVEGVYPPSLDHLVEYYGIQIDEELYSVQYELIASNLMPDITVLEK